MSRRALEHLQTQGVSDAVLGRILGGRYAVFDLLGAGGFGAVYKARQEPLNRFVAIKVIHPQQANEEGRSRFIREARRLTEIDHPAIVQVFDYGEEAGVVFMVMKWVEGQTLHQRLLQGPCPLADVYQIISIILEALQALHDLGLIHRDLKPANIILGERGKVTLIDLGIAKGLEEEQQLTPDGKVLGTLSYMAPEQLRADGRLGPWTDQYAVGILLYRLLSGRLPFRGTPAQILYAHLRELPPVIQGLPAELEAVLFRALEKEHPQRFASVLEMRKALAAVQKSSVNSPPPPQVREEKVNIMGRFMEELKTGPQKLLWGWGWSFLLLLLLLMLLLLWWLLPRSKPVPPMAPQRISLGATQGRSDSAPLPDLDVQFSDLDKEQRGREARKTAQTERGAWAVAHDRKTIKPLEGDPQLRLEVYEALNHCRCRKAKSLLKGFSQAPNLLRAQVERCRVPLVNQRCVRGKVID